MSDKLFVPPEFLVPERLDTERLRLRPLMVSDVDKDFAAVTASEDHLKTMFRPGGTWPTGLTRQKNKSDLQWHEDEFNRRTSFTYTVVALDESEVLGCVYLYPCNGLPYDAQIWLWTRQSRLAEGLDEHLFGTVKSWIDAHWPFTNPVYPGRSISHDDWNAMRPRNDRVFHQGTPTDNGVESE